MKPVDQGKKRQDLPSGLWVVATPIGCLSDISDRARRALASADRILCEDTRRTSQLLEAEGIEGVRLERTDAYASEKKLQIALERLQSGESLALVTDAGTPAISDPGADLVALAHQNGIRVVPIPGPSAVVSLLSVSGFGETSFAFRGFFPRKDSERGTEIREVLEISSRFNTRVFVWFESPQRILDALKAISQSLGAISAQTRACVAKELTKSYEKIFTGAFEVVLNEVQTHLENEGEKGEWCFALWIPPDSISGREKQESSDWVKALQCMLEYEDGNSPITASEAARRVSQFFGVAKKTVYETALKIAGKKI